MRGQRWRKIYGVGSPTFHDLPYWAELLWIGMICEADDAGYVTADPSWLRQRLLYRAYRHPRMPSVSQVAKICSVLVTRGCLEGPREGSVRAPSGLGEGSVRANTTGLKYYKITNFELYQYARARTQERKKERKTTPPTPPAAGGGVWDEFEELARSQSDVDRPRALREWAEKKHKHPDETGLGWWIDREQRAATARREEVIRELNGFDGLELEDGRRIVTGGLWGPDGVRHWRGMALEALEATLSRTHEVGRDGPPGFSSTPGTIEGSNVE